MRVVNDIEVRLIACDEKQGAVQSEVWRSGYQFKALISGSVLETAIQLDDGRYLLFLTDDIPYEDFLSINLLSHAGNLLDHASIGYPYSTGRFSLVRMEPPNKVHFSFIDNAEWMIEILPKSVLRLPLVCEPKGVWRGMRMRRHFIVQGKPQPKN